MVDANYQRVLQSTTDITVICPTDAILDSITAKFPERDRRAIQAIAEAKEAVRAKKVLLYLEGPLGIGKGALGRRICNLLDIPILLENPDASEIQRYLKLLYDFDIEQKRIGALGVNIAYRPQRLLNEAIARTRVESHGLDRLIYMDEVYMDSFVQDNLMIAEDRDIIVRWNARELNSMRGTGYSAPKEIIIQMVGSPELVYKRKNGRARAVEQETKSGGGVPFNYIQDICERYNRSMTILEKRGFRGLVIEVDQELPGRRIFEPDEERHLVPIIEIIRDYANT